MKSFGGFWTDTFYQYSVRVLALNGTFFCDTEGNAGSLFDITQEGNSPQDPVVRRQHSGQHHCRDVVEVSSPWFLVDGADIELRVKGAGAVNGIHVDDGQESEQHFGRGLDQTCVLPIPAGSVQIQAINIHSLLYTDSKWLILSSSSSYKTEKVTF